MKMNMAKIPENPQIACLSVKYHELWNLILADIELELKTITSPKPTKQKVRKSSRKSGYPLRVVFILIVPFEKLLMILPNSHDILIDAQTLMLKEIVRWILSKLSFLP